MTFKDYLLRSLTWWNGQTFGTQFYTWRHGEFVGEDEFGNRYYRAKRPVFDPQLGAERRWVVYNCEVEASKMPPGWRGWLARTVDVPPSEEPYQPREWEMAHVPNNTGTAQAYRPQGSIRGAGQRPAATGDYIPWSPGDQGP